MDSQLLQILNRIDNLKQQGRIHPSIQPIFNDLLKYIQNQTELSDAQHQVLLDSTNKTVADMKAFCATVTANNDALIQEKITTQVSTLSSSYIQKNLLAKILLQQEINTISTTSPYTYAQDHLRIKDVFRTLLNYLD
jgi:hypothetical protein